MLKRLKKIFCKHKNLRFVRQINDTAEIRLLYGRRYEYECLDCGSHKYEYDPISCDGCKYLWINNCGQGECTNSDNNKNICLGQNFIFHKSEHV